MKIAILGGTFDPPHIGHLILADTVITNCNYDKVIFIPAKIPPHKNISGKVSNDDRLNMLKLSIDIASDIKHKKTFKQIIEKLQQGISSIYQNDSFGRYKNFPSEFYIIEDEPKRGIEYLKRYLKKIDSTRTNCYSPESNSEYKNANTCRIVKYKKDNDANAIIIEYGIFRDRLTNKPIGNMSSNLELAEKEYNKLLQIPKPSLKQINKSCAIIHWLIAQESPWQRGSDSIARLLTASIYSAYGIKIFPLKKGLSFDFEAFYTNLNDYIKKYPYLFTKKPMKSKE